MTHRVLTSRSNPIDENATRDAPVENRSDETGSVTPSPAASFGDTPPGENTSAPNRLRRQFVSTVGVAFVIVLMQMSQGILLARILGPEGRGAYATAVLYVQMFLYIGLLGGLEVICRYAAEAKIEQTILRRSAFWLGITTGLITTICVAALAVSLLPAEKRHLIPHAIVCSLSIAGQQVMLIMTAVDRGRAEFGAYNVRRVIAAAAFPSLLLIAAAVFDVNVMTCCWLFVVASVISMIACLVGLPRPLSGDNQPKVPRLLRESRPYAFSMLVTELFDRLDLFLITWFVILEQQGLYAAIVPVVYPLTIVPNTMGLFLFNAGADENQTLTTRHVHRIFASAIGVQTVMTIGFLIVVGPAIRFLYGDDFAPAVQYAYWLAPASAIKGILQGLDSYLKGRGRPLAVLACRFTGIAVLLVTAWFLFDQHGTVAIAIAALASQVFCLAWFAVIVYADVKKVERAADSTSENPSDG